MRGETRKRWRILCDRAAVEQDAEKLVEIYRDIIRMLDEKASRLFNAWVKEHPESTGWQPTNKQTEKQRIM